MKCANCQVETDNPKFCSRSCSATYTNKMHPKRKVIRECAKDGCSSLVENCKTTLCEKHRKEHLKTRGEAVKNRTLQELAVDNGHRSWRYVRIRQYARSWHKELINLPCKACGYDKHVELCHIRPIADFPASATLGEINSSENIVQLCRNCHWEFDNGILDTSV